MLAEESQLGENHSRGGDLPLSAVVYLPLQRGGRWLARDIMHNSHNACWDAPAYESASRIAVPFLSLCDGSIHCWRSRIWNNWGPNSGSMNTSEGLLFSFLISFLLNLEYLRLNASKYRKDATAKLWHRYVKWVRFLLFFHGKKLHPSFPPTHVDRRRRSCMTMEEEKLF